MNFLLFYGFSFMFVKCEAEKFGKRSEVSARSQSKIVYPFGASMGLAAALAVPVTTDDEIVFVAIIFEIAYNLANNKAIPLKFFNERSFDGKIESEKCDEKWIENSTVISEKAAVFTRTSFYRVVENRLNAHRIDGKKCLLLAICESARYPFIENNGVIGHVLHILLSPSTSMDENLPPEYSKAEKLGVTNNCQKYLNRCNFNILNLFSKLF